MSQLQFLKYLLGGKPQANYVPRENPYAMGVKAPQPHTGPQNRVSPQGMTMGIGAQQYAQGGPTQPVVPPKNIMNQPGSPAAAQQAQQAIKDQSRLAPGMMNDRGPKPVEAPKTNPWAKAIADTFGRPGKLVDGVWHGPGQVALDQGRQQQKQQQQMDLLVKTGMSPEQAQLMAYHGIKPQAQQSSDVIGKDRDGTPLIKLGTKIYRKPKTGGLEPYTPGGKQSGDQKVAETMKLEDNRHHQTLVRKQMDRIKENQDDPLASNFGPGTIGGWAMSKLPMDTDAHNIEEGYEELRSREIFTQLSAMRARSKDGSSGLGQVTQKELQYLAQAQNNLKFSKNVTEQMNALRNIDLSLQYQSYLEHMVNSGAVDFESDPNGALPSEFMTREDFRSSRYYEEYQPDGSRAYSPDPMKGGKATTSGGKNVQYEVLSE
jgi:hypothetical protein